MGVAKGIYLTAAMSRFKSVSKRLMDDGRRLLRGVVTCYHGNYEALTCEG